jgi:ATP-binding cassette subfamily B protein
MKVFRRYLAYFWRERRAMALGTLCLLPAAALDLSLPLVVRGAINQFGTRPTSEYLYHAIALYLALAAGKGIFRFGMRWFLVTSSRRVEANIRNDLFRHLETLSFPYFNRTKTGDLLSRATQDVEAVRMFLGPGFMYIGDALIRIPFAIILLATAQPILVVSMGISLALLAVSVRRLTPKLHKYSEAQQKAIGDLSDRANESFAGVRVIKAFAQEKTAERLFDDVSSHYRKNSYSLISAGALSSVFFAGAKDLTLLILFGVGSTLFLMKQANVGDLYLFADYTARLYWPVFVLGWMVSMYPRARAAAIRLEEVLQTKPEVTDGPRAAGELRGAIEIRDLTFAYGPEKSPVLSGFSLRVGAGETVAIVGRTGAGKTTVASLLGRFFPVPSGRIFVDGIDINDLPVRALRSALGYVPQDHFLFSDTIFENVGFAADKPERERAQWAIERACVAEDIAEFPKALDTEIGERGITLSGGQRQRVSIARALYALPKILILDDSLSAVDMHTEEQLVRNLRDAARGRTTLLIAHRLSTVRHADRIVVLEGGRAVEEGSHDELIRRRGVYADLWQKQQLEESLEEENGENGSLASAPRAAGPSVERNGGLR